jgi:hypothetical protein
LDYGFIWHYCELSGSKCDFDANVVG